tara:strand:- start:319 stop:480 length:162 start_codon:yes stop_codon:yes gene_type:complete
MQQVALDGSVEAGVVLVLSRTYVGPYGRIRANRGGVGSVRLLSFYGQRQQTSQ